MPLTKPTVSSTPAKKNKNLLEIPTSQSGQIIKKTWAPFKKLARGQVLDAISQNTAGYSRKSWRTIQKFTNPG